MERLRHNVLRNAITAVLFAFSIVLPVQAQLKCSNYQHSDRCTIQNLKIVLTEVGSLKFPVQENIELVNLDVDYLSPEVMEQMKWVSKLTIGKGRVGRIYLKPDLQKLIAIGSETFEVIIGAGLNENLEEMKIITNYLRSIPENVEKLKDLTTLSLSGNRIEVVDMKKFHGLEKLTVLDLSKNKLYYLVPVDNLELIRLKTLDLSGNFLTELDFGGWIMPRLQVLTFSSNQLTYLANLEEETFPSLQTIDAMGNLYDCRWQNQFSDVQRNITKGKSSSQIQLGCTKTTQLSPATYRKLNMSDIRSSGFEFDNKEQLEQQINGMLESQQVQLKRIESLTASVDEQAKLLVAAKEKQLAQQVLIDGLLERVESLHGQMEQLKRLPRDAPAGKNFPKGLSEKLIQEISDLIRKNIPEEA